MARDIRKEGLDSIGEDEILSTGQVIKLTGISEGSIRKYEDKGLLEVEQTGKDVSNNRRRWRKDDIRQLGRIKALLAYGFKLDEIGLIFNGEADVVDVLQGKLEDLQREEARLHRLILFAKHIQVTDEDLVDGLLHGSLGMDDLADLVRDEPGWEAHQHRVEALTDEDLAALRESVEPIVCGLLSATVSDGFEAVEHQVDAFTEWWKDAVLQDPDASFLEVWASFEDDSLAATQVEKVGGEDACATVQAMLFFVFMKRLMLCIQDDVLQVAQHAEDDAAQALPEAQQLANGLTAQLGLEGALDADAVLIAPHVLFFAHGILQDRALLDFVDPQRAIRLTPQALERTIQTLQLLAPD